MGDEAFQKKSVRRIEDDLAKGKPVIFVSHDAAAVQRICSRAILLHEGRVVHAGPTDETLDEYHRLLNGSSH